jgi:hypothetical protein
LVKRNQQRRKLEETSFAVEYLMIRTMLDMQRDENYITVEAVGIMAYRVGVVMGGKTITLNNKLGKNVVFEGPKRRDSLIVFGSLPLHSSHVRVITMLCFREAHPRLVVVPQHGRRAAHHHHHPRAPDHLPPAEGAGPGQLYRGGSLGDLQVKTLPFPLVPLSQASFDGSGARLKNQ